MRVLRRNSCRVMTITRSFDASEDSLGTLAECGVGSHSQKLVFILTFSEG